MKRNPFPRTIPILLGLNVLGMMLSGCDAARHYRQEADSVAYGIIEQAQSHALGRKESLAIQPAADTLRRRLLIDQDLQHVGAPSLGSHDLDLIDQWPDKEYFQDAPEGSSPDPAAKTNRPLTLTLMECLQIAARNNRDYQLQKERVYQAALGLDFERDAFRYTWAGTTEMLFSSELNQDVTIDDEGNTDKQAIRGLENSGSTEVTRQLKNGMTFTGLLGLDLVKLLTQDHSSSRGVFLDGTVSIPLLRGSGEFVVTEPLTQAERDVVYAIYEIERFKRVLAVNVADEYLSVLQRLDQLHNAEENYKRLITSTRRTRRLADAGRIPEIQVDQSKQDELSASNRWIVARESYNRGLDSFKLLLGLPTDADIQLDPAELERLNVQSELNNTVTTAPATDVKRASVPADAPIVLKPPGRENAGPLELEESHAIALAIENRLDLRVAMGKVDDAQRQVAVAADALRADLTLLGSASIGERRSLASAGQVDSNLRFNEGRYSALLGMNLPFERTAERNLYRNSLIALEQTVRACQELEDEIKLEVRDDLRALLEARETVRIQSEAVKVAERRVTSTDLFLQAGRAEVRDVLEAQESLLSAQNSLTSALVQYRVAELGIQRDLGKLEVTSDGLWQEFTPEEMANDGK